VKFGETVSVISDWMLFHCFLPHFEMNSGSIVRCTLRWACFIILDANLVGLFNRRLCFW
jgi:hypothetical protein